MKCMRARHSYKACDRRVHALQTDWTCGKFVYSSLGGSKAGYRLGGCVIDVYHHGEDMNHMAYFGLIDKI